MAVRLHNLEFLRSARDLGVQFEKTLTIGRQAITSPPVVDVFASRLHQRQGTLGPQSNRSPILGDDLLVYLDQILHLLGADQVESMDVSAYEGASIIHDLNQAVDDKYKNQFSVVYDGGSLEHIFDFPRGLKNCMEMVRIGGHLILDTPANNWCGHGFYQFSPELFFRALSPANGYKLERMIAVEATTANGLDRKCYVIEDPYELGRRSELVNRIPLMLMIQARRIHESQIFAQHPQQSDYVDLWERARRKDWGSDGKTSNRDDALVRRPIRNYLIGKGLQLNSPIARRFLTVAIRQWRRLPRKDHSEPKSLSREFMETREI